MSEWEDYGGSPPKEECLYRYDEVVAAEKMGVYNERMRICKLIDEAIKARDPDNFMDTVPFVFEALKKAILA